MAGGVFTLVPFLISDSIFHLAAGRGLDGRTESRKYEGGVQPLTVGSLPGIT
jgi:hypothetical protein